MICPAPSAHAWVREDIKGQTTCTRAGARAVWTLMSDSDVLPQEHRNALVHYGKVLAARVSSPHFWTICVECRRAIAKQA